MASTLVQETSSSCQLLAHARFNRGLSPEQLAAHIQALSGQRITGRAIRNLEDGAKPHPKTAKLLADFFGVQPTDLFQGAVE